MRRSVAAIGVFLCFIVSACEAGGESNKADVNSRDFHTLPMSAEAVDRWREDIEVYASELPRRHIDLFHHLSEQEFYAEIERLKQNLPGISEMQAELALWRLTHRIGGGVGDGHTAISNSSGRYTWAPLRFDIIERDIRIVGSLDEHEGLLGRKVVAIGERTAEDVVAALSEITPYTENQQSSAFRVSRLVGNLDVLFALGITPSNTALPITVRDDAGRNETISISVSADNARPGVAPIFRRSEPVMTEPSAKFSERLWFQPVEEIDAVYVAFERYPSPGDMERFGERLSKHIASHDVENVIIDFRSNAGGNGFTGIRLAAHILPNNGIDWRDGVYVLVGKTTFSAAMMNAVNYRQILNAKIVGEPTGGNPVGYQDGDGFTLPNSGVGVSYSKRLFRLQDNPSVGVQPDVLVPVTWEDYSRGVDASLAWVFDDIRSRRR